MSLAGEAVDYWLTNAGLERRADMWGHQSTYQLYNALVNETAKGFGAVGMRYMTMADPRVDDICEPFHGREYSIGQFKPVVPRHVNCRCWFEGIWARPQAGLV